MYNGDIYSFKIVIMGESHVGKSSLIRRLCEANFLENIPQTNGIADKRREIVILNRKVNLHIWDTAGQEQYKSINRLYYRNASGALLVFDITDLKSFNQLESWKTEFQREVADGEIILIGNKVDLVDERKVTQEQARDFAIKNNMIYLETSAKNDVCVSEAFNKLGERILCKIVCGECTLTPIGEKLSKNKRTNKKCC